MSAIEVLQVVSIASAAVSVVIAAASFIMSNRKAEQQRQTEIETRQAQLFMQLYDHYNSPEYWRNFSEVIYKQESKDYLDWMSKYGPQNPEAYSARTSVMSFYCGIGVLLKNRLIDGNMVADLMGRHVIRIWNKWEPIIKHEREVRRQQTIWSDFDYLVEEMKRRGEGWPSQPELPTA